MWLLYLGAIYVLTTILIGLWGWAHKVQDRKQYNQNVQRLSGERGLFALKMEMEKAALRELERALNQLVSEKTKGFPWLAEAYAEYNALQTERFAEYLQSKKHPAIRSADEVRRIAKEKRISDSRLKQLEYLVRYYESLIPGLNELEEDDIEDVIYELTSGGEDTADPVSFWISKQEYQILSPAERNQLALDNYWKKKKSSWVLGRDFERYVGYLYESKGYKVQYHGIEKGLHDLGRDLIARAPHAKEVRIIQCKYWKKEKEIHVNHLYQLFGTTIHYQIYRDSTRELSLFEGKDKIISEFWTSAHLDAEAKAVATYLGITVVEGRPLDRSYPCIKCNYSFSRGEKIYHLPFDQQYDRTKIEDETCECYVATVAEAEAKGYRRAFRWHGTETQ